MAIYTPEQYIKHLESKSKELQSKEREIVFKVARSINNDKTQRIFTRGLNQNGRNIGNYSTKPIRISQKNSPVSIGGKTKLYQGGYKSFKSSIGRGAKVNLKLFGNLESDYSSSLTWRGDEWTEGVKRTENTKKLESIESKYGKVFNFTKTEQKKANKLLTRIFINTLRK